VKGSELLTAWSTAFAASLQQTDRQADRQTKTEEETGETVRKREREREKGHYTSSCGSCEARERKQSTSTDRAKNLDFLA